jgi:ATP-dependent DNA helicase RecQ
VVLVYKHYKFLPIFENQSKGIKSHQMVKQTTTLQDAHEALRTYYGYDTFRPLQEQVIQSIYDGQDVVLLMPTGGGKSVCFQVPAMTMPGTAIVVSPLISLMKDQVESLKAIGVNAAYLNSSLSGSEQREIEEGLYDGSYDLLYVSPEKLLSKEFFLSLPRLKINLFAIDEAHCISSWGHDFRPEYTQLQFLKKQFPHIPIIACTATADRVTRKDISKQLAMPKPKYFISSFDRPNLSLEVRPGIKRFEQILQFLDQHPNQSGIVYCLSKKSTENIAMKLRNQGYVAAAYHAGMPSQERSRIQEEFIKDETPIICATIAFGMGIDKSNVRWVIHYNLPKNLESYYQEIGRAGRDGADADTMLFYSYGDVTNWKRIIEDNDSAQKDVKVSKLERMQQYATALFCRRKVLLNYFSENRRKDCGNCDVCQNPPEYFDGTILAQKALSAVYRTRESVGINLLIDVLRGSQRKEIFQAGFQHIKTFGQGREYSYNEWRYYLEQLLNQGFLEIAHEDGRKVKLTAASKAVLFEKLPVQLVKLVTAKERNEQAKAKVSQQRQPSKRARVRDGLFDHLRQFRAKLAREEGIPPYIVFSDATLEEMAATRPTTEVNMRRVNGVGRLKWEKFGEEFIHQIEAYCEEHEWETDIIPVATETVAPKKRKQPKVNTYQVTLELFQAGNDYQAIAKERELTTNTILGHLIKLKEQGKINLDFRKLIDIDEYEQIISALPDLEKPYRLAEIFKALDNQVSFDTIRISLYLYEEEGGKNIE